MDELLRDFLTETNESLDVVDNQLVQFEQEPNNARVLGNIFRLVHTIKGTCGFIGLPRLEALTHAAETLMGKFRDGAPVTAEAVTLILATVDRIKDILRELEATQAEPAGGDADLIASLRDSVERDDEPAPADEPTQPARDPVVASAPDDAERAPVAGQSIRVNVDTLENLMTMVSELVLTRNQLLEISRRHEGSAFHTPLQRLSNVTAELQSNVMKTRMQPIRKAWQQLPRLVRDLATELGKQIELVMEGAETELDRQVLDLIKGPLTHMVRNCADHGIEPAAARVAAGKPAHGTIRLSARHEGGHIFLTIADDGRGLDTGRIRARAADLRLADERQLATMSEEQIHALIFAPGFSTAAEVTSVSGRGVGMDVVRSHVEQIGGAVQIVSTPGKGMGVTIRIPLTLAIVPALIVEAGADRFAIPQLAVAELVRADAASGHRIERIRDTAVLRLRDRLLPLIDLNAALKTAPRAQAETTGSGFIVVIQVGGQMFGVVVDGVMHTEEIVVKPLSARLRHISVFSGNTILGDGAVILIIDPNGLAKLLGGALGAETDRAHQTAEIIAADPVTSLLVFRAGAAQPKAVPLEAITRLEEIAVETIETVNGRPLVQYRGRLMPLVCIDGLTIRACGVQSVLVFTQGERAVGLPVDSIIDIVEQHLDIEIASGQAGSLGSAVIGGRATEVIDPAYYLAGAFTDGFGHGERKASRDGRAVLLVDDSPFFRTMLSAVLKSAGYRVVTASSAQDALGLLQGGSVVDAVVADTDMADMDGFALAQTLREDSRLAGIPVIALSAMVVPAMAARGRAAGICDHVAKFDRPALIAALDRWTVHLDQAA